MVELVVVLIGQVGGFAHPCGVHIVDDIVLAGLHLFAIFPVFLFAESNLHGQELAVFFEQPFNGRVLQILFEILVDMQHDIGAAVGFDSVLHRVFGGAVATPMHGFGIFLIGLREYLHLVGDHERAVETESEMSDNGFRFVFVFVHELFRTRKGDLVDVLVHLFGGHTDTMIAHGEGAFLLID